MIFCILVNGHTKKNYQFSSENSEIFFLAQNNQSSLMAFLKKIKNLIFLHENIGCRLVQCSGAQAYELPHIFP